VTPTEKKRIRAAIVAYCAEARGNEPRIHYSQQRPFRYYPHIGFGPATLDCSGFVGNVFAAAMHRAGVWLHDPLDEQYAGEGYTGTLERYLRAHGKRVGEANGYLVGDITRYGEGEHAHTTVCSKAGSGGASRWTSHGREAGPVEVRLGYRDDLIGVWRHPGLL
jgi:hypothetical protein